MGFYRGPGIVRDGLVLYLDAANTKSYPGSGTTWSDLSGNDNNASLVNGTATTTVNGGEIFMDGGDEHLRIPPSTNLANYFATGNFTIETLVRSTNGTYPRSRHPFYINGTVTSSSTKGWSVGNGYTSTRIEVRASDGTNISATTIPHTVSESTPYHRVFTVDRTAGCTTSYYVNGAYVGVHNASSVTGTIYDGTTTDFQTGVVFGYVWGWRYIGGISIIRAYNRILSTQEILQNYNATKSRFNL